jgi:hypothetical protein
MPFTADNAAAAARKSHAPESARFRPKPAPPACNDVQPADGYALKSLLRVRAQLDLVNAALTAQLSKPKTKLDAQAVDRLAAAQMRLAEQERILDGRPLPGSRRPAPDRTRRQSSSSQSSGPGFKFPGT